jgi:hypothetical protein
MTSRRDRPRVKMQALPKFPADVIAGDGITIEQSGATFTFSINETQLPQIIDFEIGVDVQAWNGALQAISDGTGDLGSIDALSSTGIAVRTTTDTWALRTLAAATGLAWTNAAGFAGDPSVALDISSLTADATPDATADYLLTYDASALAHKKALISAAAVSSIAGNRGAFTLANGIDNSTNQIQLTAARRTLPTTQSLTSGTSATYTTPANCLWIEVYMVGGGGGGAGGANSGSTIVAGSNGGTSTFNSVNAGGGTGAASTGAGGVSTTNGGAGGSGFIFVIEHYGS